MNVFQTKAKFSSIDTGMEENPRQPDALVSLTSSPPLLSKALRFHFALEIHLYDRFANHLFTVPSLFGKEKRLTNSRHTNGQVCCPRFYECPLSS
jgi:hypothetical protein